MSKHKSFLADKIKGYVEWELEHHQESVRMLSEYEVNLMPSTTQTISNEPKGIGNASDKTADAACRLLTDKYIQTAERNKNAIDRVTGALDDTDKQLVTLVYWKKSHTVEGAARTIPIGKTAAYDRINKIIYALALEMGLISV